MSQPAQALDPASPAPARGVVLVGYASFLLLGWGSLLVPSLIRDIQATFGQSDAGMGLAYLLNSLLYVTGTLAIGVISSRVPRRALLGGGPGLVALGLVAVAAAPAWPVFLVGYFVTGLGLGLIDAGSNALFIDLYAGRVAMLNRLHLFFAVGAMAAPLAVGLAVSAGVAWQAAALATAALAAPIALVFATRRLPSTHPRLAVSADGDPRPVQAPSRSAATARRGVPLPLLLLSFAIACYVASELGISSWLVRYLQDAPIVVATLSLSMFWGAIGLSRLVSSFIADRMGAVAFATLWSSVCGVAILAALVATPVLPLAMVLFAVAGFAAGPVFPSIMAIGGALHPGRGSMVSSVLTSAGITGSIIYPPLMGVVSEVAGLWVGIAGAGVLAIGAGILIYLASRVGSGRRDVAA